MCDSQHLEWKETVLLLEEKYGSRYIQRQVHLCFWRMQPKEVRFSYNKMDLHTKEERVESYRNSIKRSLETYTKHGSNANFKERDFNRENF